MRSRRSARCCLDRSPHRRSLTLAQVYSECDSYTNVYGSAVLEIEYTDNDNAKSVYKKACSARGAKISIILRDRDVVPKGSDGYSYTEC